MVGNVAAESGSCCYSPVAEDLGSICSFYRELSDEGIPSSATGRFGAQKLRENGSGNRFSRASTGPVPRAETRPALGRSGAHRLRQTRSESGDECGEERRDEQGWQQVGDGEIADAQQPQGQPETQQPTGRGERV